MAERLQMTGQPNYRYGFKLNLQPHMLAVKNETAMLPCASKGDALARYTLENLPNKVMAAEYKTVLPNEKHLAAEIERTRTRLERQRA